MALLTVQNVIDRVSQDVRRQIAASGSPDVDILIDYVNRIHLDLLRTSRWQFLLSPIKTFNTVVGKSDYYIGTSGLPSGAVDTTLALADIDTIKRGDVFDRTNFRPLFPTLEQPLLKVFTLPSPPRLWRFDVSTPSLLNLYPPTDGVYAIEFRYFAKPTILTAVGNTTQVPDKYVGVFVAGVNELAYAYLKRYDDASYWATKYAQGKRDIVRDQNMIPRGPEFMSPDPQASRPTQWWSFESGGSGSFVQGGAGALQQYSLSGFINGSNTTYTLSGTPPSGAAVIIFLNGLLQAVPVDYSRSGTVVTFVNPPQVGDSLVAYF